MATRVSTVVFWMTVGCAGGSIMLIEILGARVIGPVFGVGLYVWSSLISVALGALAIGYTIGGKLADKRPTMRLLHYVLGASGIWSALLPIISSPVLLLAAPLGLRAGPLVSASLLFGPLLTLLGMVSPIAIRLNSFAVSSAGSTAGKVFAVSTVAGVASALLTGFLLIPSFGVDSIWVGNAAVLLATAALGVVVQGGPALTLALPLVAGLGALSVKKDPESEVRVIESAQSAYAKLVVLEDTSRGTPLRLLRANHSFIGAVWIEAGEPAFSFLHLPEAVLLARPSGKSMLLLGLGAGSVPAAMKKHGVKTDVVELDGEVVRLAQKHFGFVPSGEVFVEDARTFIRRTENQYDFIVQDTFTGGDNPEHLLSLEMLRQLKARLNPGGVLVVSIIGSDRGPTARVAQALNKTIRNAFESVRVFRDAPEHKEGLANLLFFASAGPISFDGIEQFHFESETCEHQLRSFQQWETLKVVDETAPLITDNNNPLVQLSLPVSEEFHAAMNRMYPLEFWVN